MITGYEEMKVIMKDLKEMEDMFSDENIPESLLVPTGTIVARIVNNNYELLLYATGEVRIEDTETDTIYRYDDRFKNEELMKAIKTGEIYDTDRYIIHDNNWFDLYIYDRGKEDELITAFVYEDEPENPVSMILNLMEILEKVMKEEGVK